MQKKNALDALGDHVNTCTVHSGVKKTHDWTIEQIADLFCTTHKVKTQQVVRNRGQWCGDIDLTVYLPDGSGTVSLVLDLRITHDRWRSTSNPILDRHLHYPQSDDIDR